MNANNFHGKTAAFLFVLCAMAMATSFANAYDNKQENAQIIVYNFNDPGIGFNDPTPATPVGGNTGTTVGQQRLNAFSYAAKLWSKQLNSKVPITIVAAFDPLPCSADSAVLGAAGANNAFADFPKAEKPATWYNAALANKIAKQTLIEPTGYPYYDADIFAEFNADLGKPNCLEGSGFYLGFDNNHGTLIDLVTVLLHEFAHGLGFQTFTDGYTGEQFLGMPHIWDHFLYDNAQKRTWVQMTNAERQVSSLNTQGLVWDGEKVTNAAPRVLARGVPELHTVPDIANGAEILLGTASFGPAITSTGIRAKVGQVSDQVNGTGLACNPLNAANAAAIFGKIALIDRGACAFTVKVRNAQNVGALAVLVADNIPGSPPNNLGGLDPSITIPAARITNADGLSLKAVLSTGEVAATLAVNLARLNGADKRGRVFLYAPNPFADGSSISHYDVSAFPNQLMEFSINSDLQHQVSPPSDLTKSLLDDTGWAGDE